MFCFIAKYPVSQAVRGFVTTDHKVITGQGVPVLKVSDLKPKRGWVGKDHFGKRPFIAPSLDQVFLPQLAIA